MEEKHYITFISLVTDDKIIRVDLKPGDEPVVRLPYVSNADIYEYCNLHGLWKSTVE
jgi:superoxide reductase